MTLRDDIAWFKSQFGPQTKAALVGTPFTLDLITAIALQESGEVWQRAWKTHPVTEVLYLCVGDIIDRRVFPHSRAALEAVPWGKMMFQVARKAIEAMSGVATEYKRYLRNPNKFAHAFGIFQYDIQVFKETSERQFFLNEEWRDYAACLGKCLGELEQKRRHVFGSKKDLTRSDLVYVAIAYNKGSARVGAGFKQGFKSGGKYYGELIDQYMRASAGVGDATQ